MTFRENGDMSGGNVSAGGSGGGGGGGGGFGGRGMMIGGGGGIGAIVIAVIVMFLNSSGGGGGTGGTGGSDSAAMAQLDQKLNSCTYAQANTDTACRIKATTISLNKVWPELLRGYQPPKGGTKIMPAGTRSINTACGTVGAESGPFYCPTDQVAVFQLDFMDRVIKQMGGSNQAFSQEYIVAHEFGHHVQNLLGDIGRSQQGLGAQGGSVRVELQADCYAGVWAAHADKGADALLAPLTQAQIKEALDTAAAIGDDTIQKNAGRQVNPESFSHGSSAQRVKWFTTGYQSGDPARCDTFSGSI